MFKKYMIASSLQGQVSKFFFLYAESAKDARLKANKMKLTRHSDYSLRVLVYLGAHPGRAVPLSEICRSFDISQNHVAKVANKLLQLQFVTARRGKTGGYLLAKAPEEIGVGEVIRKTEPDMDLLECFNPEINTCKIAGACRLQFILNEAQAAFLAVLDHYTVKDLLENSSELRDILQV